MAEITITQRPAHVRHGSNIGQPLTRRDGVLKVTGQARYAADHHPRGMLYAVLAVSSIARGRVTFLDVEAAKAHPGVVDVITPANRPALAQDPDEKTNPFTFRLDLLQSDKVRYANQPIAVVVAETFEAATEGAALLSPRYDTDPPRVGLDAAERFIPPEVGVGNPPQVHRGDVEAGLAAASKQIEATYETASQYHNAMEPHAIVASWDGDTLSIDMPSQGLALAQARLAGLFGISPDKIHIRSPFLGGGFGSKGLISGPQVLGIIAARVVGKPVKLVLRREQMFGPVGHRAPTRQTLRMGTNGEGKLRALDHRTRTTSTRSTTSSSLHPIFPTPFMQAPPSQRRMKLFESTPERRFSCARQERQRVRSRSKVRSTKWLTPAARIHWRSGSGTMPRWSRSRANRSLQRRCATATRKARRASAGSAAYAHPAACATMPDFWSAGA